MKINKKTFLIIGLIVISLSVFSYASYKTLKTVNQNQEIEISSLTQAKAEKISETNCVVPKQSPENPNKYMYVHCNSYQ